MKRVVEALGVLASMAMAAVGAADPTGEYPNYYAARRALERNDCEAGVDYLRAFLRNHPYLRERHPDFYLEIKLVMGQCTGAVRVRGAGDESLGIDPLPERTPMEE